MFFISSLLFASCQKQLQLTTTTDEVIKSKAKEWFNQELKNENEFNKEFQNLNYDWSAVRLLKDGSKSVVLLPASPKKMVVNYKSLIVVAIYPKLSEQGYITKVFYIQPTGDLRKQNTIQNYTGLLSTWDMRKGFINGLMYENGTKVTSIKSFNYIYSNAKNGANSLGGVYSYPPVTVTATPSTASSYVAWKADMMNIIQESNNFGMGNGSNPNEYGNYNTFTEEELLKMFEDYLNNHNIIEENLQHECLRLKFQQLINSNNGDNYFHKSHTILSNSIYHFNFNDNSTGNTDPTKYITSTITGNGMDINLNYNLLNSSSQEYISGTLLNSVFNAYFNEYNVHGLNINDFTRCVDLIAENIKNQYGNTLPRGDEYAIAINIFYNQNSSLLNDPGNMNTNANAYWDVVVNRKDSGSPDGWLMPRVSLTNDDIVTKFKTMDWAKENTGEKYAKNHNLGNNSNCNN